MKERIFIISPLPEDEEEEIKPYDEHGNTTAMAYYDEQGNTTETDYQEQPEEETTIEKHITIIYEASKPKVITQENQTPEAIPIFPTMETTPADSQPEPRYDKFLSYSNEKRAKARDTLLSYVYGENTSEPRYDKFLSYSNEKRAKARDTLLSYVYDENTSEPRYDKPLNYAYSTQPIEQLQSEQSQLVSIRTELAALTPATGEPAPQAGEIQAAA